MMKFLSPRGKETNMHDALAADIGNRCANHTKQSWEAKLRHKDPLPDTVGLYRASRLPSTYVLNWTTVPLDRKEVIS
jgi:hypothetical protein